MKNNGGFLIVMQIKLLFFVVCLFAITSSLAHQPVLNTNEEMSASNPYVIKEPEISKAIYSTLNGANHFYKISSDIPFNFYAGLTVPKIDDCIDFPRFSFAVLDQDFHPIQELDQVSAEQLVNVRVPRFVVDLEEPLKCLRDISIGRRHRDNVFRQTNHRRTYSPRHVNTCRS